MPQLQLLLSGQFMQGFILAAIVINSYYNYLSALVFLLNKITYMCGAETHFNKPDSDDSTIE